MARLPSSLMPEYYSLLCGTQTPHFLHSFIDGHLSCFHVLTTVNNASVNTGVHIPFQISIFVFFGSRIAGPYDSSIFNFLQNLHAVSIEISHSVKSNSLRPHGYSPLGSSIHGISPIRILEWVAISFSRGSS